jgi:Transcriptional Coactivator p15 (PC4)
MENNEEVYSRVVHYDEVKDIEVRLAVSIFRGVEYISLRKYYRDFDEIYKPSNEGVNMPLDLSNSKELFIGLLEILSLGEAKDSIIETFSELLKDSYQ